MHFFSVCFITLLNVLFFSEAKNDDSLKKQHALSVRLREVPDYTEAYEAFVGKGQEIKLFSKYYSMKLPGVRYKSLVNEFFVRIENLKLKPLIVKYYEPNNNFTELDIRAKMLKITLSGMCGINNNPTGECSFDITRGIFYDKALILDGSTIVKTDVRIDTAIDSDYVTVLKLRTIEQSDTRKEIIQIVRESIALTKNDYTHPFTRKLEDTVDESIVKFQKSGIIYPYYTDKLKTKE